MLSRVTQTVSAQFITRLLILSYFIAVAIGVIQGTDYATLATPLLPELPARYVMRLLVITLCGLVLFDIWRRAAALVLALVVFWTSYLSLYAGGELGAFWRDLGLIGALLIIADIARPAEKVKSDEAPVAEPEAMISQSEPVPVRKNLSYDRRFREDFDIVRAS